MTRPAGGTVPKRCRSGSSPPQPSAGFTSRSWVGPLGDHLVAFSIGCSSRPRLSAIGHRLPALEPGLCGQGPGSRCRIVMAVRAGPDVQMPTVRLTRGTSTRAYRLLYGPTVSLADADPAGGVEPPTLVFTSIMTPRSAEAFRRAGLQYLDLVGNA